MRKIIYDKPLIRTSETIAGGIKQETTADVSSSAQSRDRDIDPADVSSAPWPGSPGSQSFQEDSPANELRKSSPKRSFEIEESVSALQTRALCENPSQQDYLPLDHDETPRKKFKETNDSANSHQECHPPYRHFALRLKTFRSLPHQDIHDSNRMARAGLFHTENPDIVRCFHCGIEIKGWTAADDPLQEHIWRSPNCEFLRSSIPQNGLQTVQTTLLQNTPPIKTPARHPDYRSMQLRFETFCDWPHHKDIQDRNRLAQTGLFYTGIHDLVRCFQCGIGFKDWASSDDPLQVHIQQSPNCEFLRTTIPQSEIETYRLILSTANTGDVGQYLIPNAPPSRQLKVKYRNPSYEEYDARVASFSQWPSYIKQTPQKMAEAGFFYTGMEDIVRCYACDGGLRKWDPEDNPWIEHAHWFKHCIHVIRERGQEYIDMIQVAAADGEDDEGDVQSGQMKHLYINNKTGQKSYDPIDSSAAQTALDFGFSRAAVKIAIQEGNDKHIHWKAEDLLNILLEKQDKGEILPPDTQRTISSMLRPKTDATSKVVIIVDHEMLIRHQKCILCEEKEVNVLFMPCAHHNMCMTCAEEVTMCPMCGKTVQETIQTFMS